ncbi:phosphopantetheine-binding protein [Peristeroidobacter agariperforans]|uniref:phosphopantetheine-binding protein n=1 Tax=Peristeroidobacter agariperforans TaxID=268404 RepID=UPI00101CC9ED|nr:phosphopantetheine-binding protein [Peristeroidobacter agariperforans]
MLGLTNRIEGKVLAVIAEKLSAREQMLTPRTDFRRDLGADLLAMIEFVMLREATFDVDIPHEDPAQISTVSRSSII